MDKASGLVILRALRERARPQWPAQETGRSGISVLSESTRDHPRRPVISWKGMVTGPPFAKFSVACREEAQTLVGLPCGLHYLFSSPPSAGTRPSELGASRCIVSRKSLAPTDSRRARRLRKSDRTFSQRQGENSNRAIRGSSSATGGNRSRSRGWSIRDRCMCRMPCCGPYSCNSSP